MPLPNTNPVINKLAVKERWVKLYRTLYNRFLKFDFIHRLDYLQDLQQTHARITQVETALNTTQSQLTATISAQIAGHIHLAPQAPAGTLPTGPGIGPPPAPPTPSAATVAAHQDANLEQKGSALLSLGPATAPLANSTSFEGQVANVQVQEDIVT